jgi:hypothetical protein
VAKFGFERAQKNSQLLYNTNTLGFAEDSKRTEAFEKWKKLNPPKARQVEDNVSPEKESGKDAAEQEKQNGSAEPDNDETRQGKR